MDVRPFIVHVSDAVVGLVVLDTRPRFLAAHPPRFPASERLTRCLLAQDPPVVFGASTISMHPARPLDCPSDWETIRCKLRQTCSKIRINVSVQNLGSR